MGLIKTLVNVFSLVTFFFQIIRLGIFVGYEEFNMDLIKSLFQRFFFGYFLFFKKESNRVPYGTWGCCINATTPIRASVYDRIQNRRRDQLLISLSSSLQL
jgi:hypothetical protein